MSQITDEMETAAVLALAQHNVPVDIQSLLITGGDATGVKPGALKAALASLSHTMGVKGLDLLKTLENTVSYFEGSAGDPELFPEENLILTNARKVIKQHRGRSTEGGRPELDEAKQSYAELLIERDALETTVDELRLQLQYWMDRRNETSIGVAVVTDEMVKRYRNKFKEIWPGSGWPDRDTTIELLTAVLRSALTPTRQPEPVAWQWRYRRNVDGAPWGAWGDHNPSLRSYQDWSSEKRPLYALAQPQDVPGWKKAIDELERVLDQADHCLTGYGIGKVDIRGSMVELANQVSIGRKALAALNAEVSK